MDKAEKQKLSESDICDLFITPAIKRAGWDQFKGTSIFNHFRGRAAVCLALSGR